MPADDESFVALRHVADTPRWIKGPVGAAAGQRVKVQCCAAGKNHAFCQRKRSWCPTNAQERVWSTGGRPEGCVQGGIGTKSAAGDFFQLARQRKSKAWEAAPTRRGLDLRRIRDIQLELRAAPRRAARTARP